MDRLARLLAAAIAGVVLLVEFAHAYNSEEHKLLVDMGAAMVRIDPSIQLPAPTGMRTLPPPDRRAYYRNAKYFAVGDSSNSGNINDQRKGCQDNSYWSGNGWDQSDYNRKIYIPTVAEVRATTLEVAGWTGGAGTQGLFTMGELAAIYGDYKRTVYCVDGNCYLTNGNAANIRFDEGADCFGVWPFEDCGWEPGPFAFDHYLRYIGSGLVPPYDPSLGGNVALGDYDEAAWWGDEMYRIAGTNDWHFSSGAVAWYIGCHRLALYYANLARNDARHWNTALHLEAHGLHSLTDLFAFGHVVASRDRTSHATVNAAGATGSTEYDWMENVLHCGGASRGEFEGYPGHINLGTSLPVVADVAGDRPDLLATYVPATWAGWGLQEADFHDCYNKLGARVRNLAGDSFRIFGDGAIESLNGETRAIIAEAVRASIQSLFDGCVELGRGRTVEQVAAVGSPFFAALKKIPIFTERNFVGHCDNYGPDVDTGNNYNGRWTIYAEVVDVIAGTDIVPAGTGCVMPYQDGSRYMAVAVQDTTPCQTFPVIAPPPTGQPAQFDLEQSFPNPFAASATIRFSLARPARVVLEIFDLTGGKIRTLVDEDRSQGPHFATWDATNGQGEQVGAGLYFYSLTIEGERRTKVMTFVP